MVKKRVNTDPILHPLIVDTRDAYRRAAEFGPVTIEVRVTAGTFEKVITERLVPPSIPASA